MFFFVLQSGIEIFLREEGKQERKKERKNSSSPVGAKAIEKERKECERSRKKKARERNNAANDSPALNEIVDFPIVFFFPLQEERKWGWGVGEHSNTHFDEKETGEKNDEKELS